ncbi:MAG: diguanylate cyclase [Ruminococcaceae bacterium]|nr:diguanylate cyclase [Oscillospiraceae bacterium]
MEKLYKKKQNRSIVLYAIATITLLCSVILVMVANVYKTAENEAFEKLHMETAQIKRDITLQMYSDRENLVIMSNFASKLYEDGEGYELLFNSFEEIGLFEDVRILQPDNRFITQYGAVPSGDLIFEDEVKKGTYISDRVTDLVNQEKEVVRSAVPVTDKNGKTVAIIYGIIDLQKFEDRYIDDVRALGADLFVIEQESGKFVIDTKREGFGLVSELARTNFEDGYSYEQMASGLSSGDKGFASFDSIVTGQKLYAHFSPLEFAKWEIMMAKPASSVFEVARRTGGYMLLMAAILVFIMLCYVAFVVGMERRNLAVSVIASTVKKRLLEINQNMDRMSDALKLMTEFANARSAFFVDNYGEDRNYVSPKYRDKMLTGKDREFFIKKIDEYLIEKQSKHGTNVYITSIKPNDELKENYSELCEFMHNHEIRSIHIASVTHNNRNNSVIGVINAQDKQITVLLKDIAVCFSMAVYNKRYLTDTESMAITDALTGVANRLAYKNDIKVFENTDVERFTCIYIDVNELNFYNNKYGHAAGDQMLVYIAEVLTEEFGDSNIYRMGGDEFLIFTCGISRDEIENRMARANVKIKEMKYNISIGIKKRSEGMGMEELVNEAEKRMYIQKARYYQNKDEARIESTIRKGNTRVIKSGIREIDAYLSILKNRHYGVFEVSMDQDSGSSIIAPTGLFDMSVDENRFSDVIKQYIHDFVKPEFHRNLRNFIQYDVVRNQLEENIIPKISYYKKDGTAVKLSIWPVDGDEGETMWIFEKEDNI